MMKPVLLLSLVVLTVAGCVVEGSGDNQPVAVPGNVNVLWKFSDGSTCDTTPVPIANVEVQIPGQQLQGGGNFECVINGTQGVQLDNFSPGDYSISVVANDPNGNPVYTWSGSFTVNGDVEVDALLVPVAPAAQPGDVTLIWSFTDGSTCDSPANGADPVDHIQVTIPGQVIANGGNAPCEAAGTMGEQFDNFAPGNYNFVVDAVDAAGVILYSFSGTFSVNGDVTVQVPLAPTGNGAAPTASVNLQWAFADPSGGLHTCADVGVDTVTVDFSGFGTTSFPCDVNGVEGTTFDNLPTGSFNLTVDGLSNGAVTFGLSEGVILAAGPNTLNLALQPQ